MYMCVPVTQLKRFWESHGGPRPLASLWLRLWPGGRGPIGSSVNAAWLGDRNVRDSNASISESLTASSVTTPGLLASAAQQCRSLSEMRRGTGKVMYGD